jgi:Pre-mRNA-splicing factor of RES complex
VRPPQAPLAQLLQRSVEQRGTKVQHSVSRCGAARRFGIKPGRHWDGVHRSNGFEKKFVFEYANRSQLRETDRYLSMMDM